MAKQFDVLSAEHRRFIERQPIFFVATAPREGHVNLSPKGGPDLAILGPTRILWLNLTGSGNETAAHLLDSNRITLMWCAFEGPPQILRVYGRGRAIHADDDEWSTCAQQIPAVLGARQYFSIDVDLVLESCGYAVPQMDYRADRSALMEWAEAHGEEGIRAYQAAKNTQSLDGLPTGLPTGLESGD